MIQETGKYLKLNYKISSNRNLTNKVKNMKIINRTFLDLKKSIFLQYIFQIRK